ncbi:hypothetical protein [Megamonas hypermegale]|uniref:hypothetical protein n=1 Tax=Megamonas hypermegale TaxID=158847 RepID=UPI0026EE7CC9|nr:hypothetical protein [Megamonas hypermegale]
MGNLYGVVVIYNSGNEVIKNMKTYLPYLKKLYVMDNSEIMNKPCIKSICRLSNKIEYKFLNCNMGIAYPINLVIEQLEKDDWLLTMDQDSYFYEDSFSEYIKILPELKENVYAITPEIIYKNVFDLNNVKKIQLKKISKCIQSGAIFSVRIAKKVDGFNEDFFIDAVDTEYCYKCNKKGYILYQNNTGILIHKLGNRIDNIKTKWLPFPLRQHNVLRRYYIVRNNLYLKDYYPDKKMRIIAYLFAGIIKIILFDDDVINKIKMIIKAYKDYKNNIVGKLEEKG